MPDPAHGLCGNIKYEVCYDSDCDLPVNADGTNDCVGFNDQTNEIELYCTNGDELGTKPYTVRATLEGYPDPDGSSPPDY